MDIEEDKEFYPIMESVKTHKVCAKIIPFNANKKGFSDLTVAFLHKSSCENSYVMAVYDFDSNVILSGGEWQAATIRDAFHKIHNILKSRGSYPKVYITNN